MPAREPGLSKGPRRLETAQAVALAGKFVPAKEPGSSKGPGRSESAQATSTEVRVVRARSTQVELRLKACEECISCISGGTSSACQEHTGRVKARSVQRSHKLYQRRHK